MNALFWSLVWLIFYAYCGYPLLLALLSLFRMKTNKKAPIFPPVTVIVAAYNEEKCIAKKIAATLNLDYPADKLEVIVASDGSTDGTVRQAGKFSGRRVRVIAFDQRKGKTFVQNEAVKKARGEIIIFSDATTEFDRRAVAALVSNFADPAIGAAGGELRYVNRASGGAGAGGGFYWAYERLIKKLESRVCSLIGVSGCCYAVRKRLYEDIPADLISDFVIAQLLFKKGARTVYEPAAVSYEQANDCFTDEFSMRVRVAVRTLHGLWRMRGLFNPLRYGFFALELFSHKVLRYLIPALLAAALAVNILLFLGQGRGSALTLALQLAFYAAAAAGWFFRGKKYVSIPFYFFVTNLALAVGMLRFLRGERQVLWKPVRK